MKDKIVLAEEPFLSIQGEGCSMGTKSVFIRFKGCNLACKWCDSKFTWSKEKESFSFTIEEFVKKYQSLLLGFGNHNIIFTGGEPTLYQDEIIGIISELERIEPEVTTENTYEIETNGTVVLKPEFLIFMGNRRTLINVSPKAEYPISAQKVIDNVTKWILDGSALQLKFVDDREPGTRKFIEDMVDGLKDKGALEWAPVYVMPECITRQQHIDNFQTTFDYCLEQGFNFSPRLHILLWDKKKGV